MRTLLDTCVISELRQSRPDPTVLAAVSRIPQADLFISVISMGEIQKGIALLPQGLRRRELDLWFAGLSSRFTDQLVDVDLDTAIIWGELSASIRLGGRTVMPADLLIAASALRHGLRVMTRNTRDFVSNGVPLIDPWVEGDPAG
jgi:predicted nucleic acid-binding protein